MTFVCPEPEADWYRLAAEQGEVRAVLEDVREVLGRRGEIVGGALALAIALSRCERLLAELDSEEVS